MSGKPQTETCGHAYRLPPVVGIIGQGDLGGEYQNKYQDYRALAEAIRVWTLSMEFQEAPGATAAIGPDRLRLVLNEWVTGQRRFFANAEQRLIELLEAGEQAQAGVRAFRSTRQRIAR